MQLSKTEEQLMQHLWKLEKAFVKDILDEFPEPRPAYNTVSTIVRILENKGVNPTQITAAGRSEFLPIDSNKTTEGKAKNRRIEIIISPNLNALFELISKD